VIVISLLLLPGGASAAAPANDDFQHAAPIGGPPASVAGTTGEATSQPGEPVEGRQRTVWYAFRASTTERVGINLHSPSAYGLLSVYSGPAVGVLHRIGVAEGFGSYSDLRVEFDAVSGETYWVQVATYDDDVPEFTLDVTSAVPPSNDSFYAAQPVTVGKEYAGSIADASAELGEPGHDNSGPSHSVWFRFRARRTAPMTIDSGGSKIDTSLSAYTGGKLSDLRLVAEGAFNSPTGQGAVIRFTAKRGTTYRIALDSATNFIGAGSYALWVSDGGVKGKGLTLDVDPGQTVASVRAQGLHLTVGARRAVKVGIELLVGRRVARQLRLKNRVLGAARGLVNYGQQLGTTIRLSRAARRALRGRTSLAATARLTILDRRAPDRVLTRKVALTG
jgi:hypothetical protein